MTDLQKINHELTQDAFQNPIQARRVQVTLSDFAVEFDLITQSKDGEYAVASVHLEIDPEGHPVLRLWDERDGVNNDPRICTIIETGEEQADPRE